MPENVAWVLTKGRPYFFLTENLRSGAARPSRGPSADGPDAPNRDDDETPVAPSRQAQDFSNAFRAAFEILDRRNGSTNFVKLADLRRALAEFSREDFDAGLRAAPHGGCVLARQSRGPPRLAHRRRARGGRARGRLAAGLRVTEVTPMSRRRKDKANRGAGALRLRLRRIPRRGPGRQPLRGQSRHRAVGLRRRRRRRSMPPASIGLVELSPARR